MSVVTISSQLAKKGLLRRRDLEAAQICLRFCNLSRRTSRARDLVVSVLTAPRSHGVSASSPTWCGSLEALSSLPSITVRYYQLIPCPRPSDCGSCRLFSSNGYFSEGQSEIRKKILPLTQSPVRNLSLLFSSDGYFSEGQSEIREKILPLTESPVRNLSLLDDLRSEINKLAANILSLPDEADLQEPLETSSASSLLERSKYGVVFVELLSQLQSRPLLALNVFKWRRGLAESGVYPMLPEEYVKAITLAGRARNVELADKLFNEATISGLRTTSTYNALMTVYMHNEIVQEAMSLFKCLMRDESCCPTIVTYNILLSICRHSFFVERMEDILNQIKESNLRPTLKTFNTLIAGYITAGMWDKMERTFKEMEDSPVKPHTSTYLLMLRGYAHAVNLEMMEKMFELVKDHVIEQEVTLIRTMICAYCRSSSSDRVEKIEALMEYTPKDQYRPWLNVLLIRLYANEGLVDKMEMLIDEAFYRRTVVIIVGIMKSIITGYFKCETVDKLVEFVKRAELAGWRLCRSLYHCKMVMYGKQQRFAEMHNVLDEMEYLSISPCKRTFWIMFKAYIESGKRLDAQRVLGLMWKHGFTFSEDILS